MQFRWEKQPEYKGYEITVHHARSDDRERAADSPHGHLDGGDAAGLPADHRQPLQSALRGEAVVPGQRRLGMILSTAVKIDGVVSSPPRLRACNREADGGQVAEQGLNSQHLSHRVELASPEDKSWCIERL